MNIFDRQQKEKELNSLIKAYNATLDRFDTPMELADSSWTDHKIQEYLDALGTPGLIEACVESKL